MGITDLENLIAQSDRQTTVSPAAFMTVQSRRIYDSI